MVFSQSWTQIISVFLSENWKKEISLSYLTNNGICSVSKNKMFEYARSIEISDKPWGDKLVKNRSEIMVEMQKSGLQFVRVNYP